MGSSVPVRCDVPTGPSVTPHSRTLAAVWEALSSGPKRTAAVAELTGIPEPEALKYLRWSRGMGRVRVDGRGEWCLA